MPFANGPPVITELGYTTMPRRKLVEALKPHFGPGSYDLLRKNCNSFSDCALYFLLGQRLDEKYRSMEKVGATADTYTALIRGVTGGNYQPNPRADNFKSCAVVERLGREAEKKAPGAKDKGAAAAAAAGAAQGGRPSRPRAKSGGA
jgi:hypothetical protein